MSELNNEMMVNDEMNMDVVPAEGESQGNYDGLIGFGIGALATSAAVGIVHLIKKGVQKRKEKKAEEKPEEEKPKKEGLFAKLKNRKAKKEEKETKKEPKKDDKSLEETGKEES